MGKNGILTSSFVAIYVSACVQKKSTPREK